MTDHLPPVGIARVAVPSPLRQAFDYWIPAGIGPVEPGMRVRVPFGRGTRVAVVMSLPAEPAVEADQLKALLEVLDDEPIIPPTNLALIGWASRYYHHPVGEVFQTAVPVALRRAKSSEQALGRHAVRYWTCTAAGAVVDPTSLGRAVRQSALLRVLQDAATPLPEDALHEQPNWRDTMRRLQEKGWVETAAPAEREVDTSPVEAKALNESQQAAVDTVVAKLSEFGAFLLDGVTGSGKTEVYLDIIRAVIANGRQTLVLVPEIGLTPQMVARFTGALHARIGVVHSAMSDSARLQIWAQARAGNLDVIIGTRSAIFIPLRSPGLFVVDEEHDLSFKQQDGFRYSARDLSVVCANRYGVPVVLGSATPSLETLHNARAGRYERLVLKHRAGGASMPAIRIIDVRKRPLEQGLSEPLLAAVRERLERGEQSLLFVNRRGFAPVLLCHECGWVADCERCDAHMVIHASSRRIRCHHCGADRPSPPSCPECGSAELLAVGLGTERVASALQAEFPSARIARVDRDTVRRQGAMAAILDDIQAQSIDIVVGTQMVAKGHDFPNVTLVGVLDADGGLFGADFRASERMAQLIVQVAGRAGRGQRPGEVFVQSHHPMHPLLQALREEGYPAFATAALDERREAQMPPFAALALLRAEAASREQVFDFLGQARELARPWTDPPRGSLGPSPFDPPGQTAPAPAPPLATPPDSWIMALGPAPAPMERRSGRFRAQLLIQAGARGDLHAMLDPWLAVVTRTSAARKVRWSLDVDPQETL